MARDIIDEGLVVLDVVMALLGADKLEAIEVSEGPIGENTPIGEVMAFALSTFFAWE